MNRHEFEALARRSNLRPVLRGDLPEGVVLIADGQRHCPEADGQAYTTLWAFGRDEERLEVAQPMYFDRFFRDKGGVWKAVTEEVRLEAAKAAAAEWARSRGRRATRH